MYSFYIIKWLGPWSPANKVISWTLPPVNFCSLTRCRRICRIGSYNAKLPDIKYSHNQHNTSHSDVGFFLYIIKISHQMTVLLIKVVLPKPFLNNFCTISFYIFFFSSQRISFQFYKCTKMRYICNNKKLTTEMTE